MRKATTIAALACLFNIAITNGLKHEHIDYLKDYPLGYIDHGQKADDEKTDDVVNVTDLDEADKEHYGIADADADTIDLLKKYPLGINYGLEKAPVLHKAKNDDVINVNGDLEEEANGGVEVNEDEAIKETDGDFEMLGDVIKALAEDKSEVESAEVSPVESKRSRRYVHNFCTMGKRRVRIGPYTRCI